MIVDTARPILSRDNGVECGSCRISSTAWPTRREIEASGATLSWRDVPKKAYTSPGIDAENWRQGKQRVLLSLDGTLRTRPVTGLNLARVVA